MRPLRFWKHCHSFALLCMVILLYLATAGHATDFAIGPAPIPLLSSAGGGVGSGTVTNVATGSGLTGGPITTTGTLNLANVAAVSHKWFNSVVGNVFVATQPALADLSDTVTAGQLPIGNAGGTAFAPATLSGAGATFSLASTGILTISGIADASLTNTPTHAAIVPNTAPSAGQLLVGNAGGTAYAPVSLSGSGVTATLSSAGVLTLSAIANATLSNSSITVTGTANQIAVSVSPVALGASTVLSLVGPYTPATYTAHGVLIGEGTSSLVATAAMTNGQLLVGATGADPAPQTISCTGATCTLSSAGVLALSAVSLTASVTGVLPYANGGTNASTSWTQGSVLFAGASALAQDNANFFWDATNHRLGIGTVTPAVVFHILASVDTGQTFEVTAAGRHTVGTYFKQTNFNNWFVGQNYIANDEFDIVDVTHSAGRIGIDLNGNILLGAASGAGTSAVKVLVQALATAPTTSPASVYQQYAKNVVAAGTAGVFWRDEESNVYSAGHGYFSGPGYVLGKGDLSGALTGGTFRGPNADGTTSNVGGVVTTLAAADASGTGSAGTLQYQVALTKAASGASLHALSTILTMGNTQAAHPGTTGAVLDHPAVTWNDENTAASGTAANWTQVAFQQPTLTARNTGVTTTAASTVYIANAPVASTNQTITNAWAFNVNAGKVRMGGLSTDSASVDNTLCLDTTSKELKTGTGAAGICLGTSGEQFKHDIHDIPFSALSVLQQLRPRTYYYNEGYVDSGSKRQMGFIAQEVNRILPQLVNYNAEGVPINYDWGQLIPLTVKALQEQQAQIAALQQAVTRLHP